MAEKAIPHSHVEQHGYVVPDFSNSPVDAHDSEEGESLHSTYYQIDNNSVEFNLPLLFLFVLISFVGSILQKDSIQLRISYYKFRKRSLVYIRNYSYKAPPLHSIF